MENTTVPRRLAAILAADVVGYSRLMGPDEVGTLRALKAHRRELGRPAHRRAPRPHRQDHRRRPAGRVRQRRRCRGLRRRDPARHDRAQRGGARRQAHRLPHRHQCRRHHHRRRRHLRRRRQRRRAPRGAVRARRPLHLARRQRADPRQAVARLRRPGRADGEEYRARVGVFGLAASDIAALPEDGCSAGIRAGRSADPRRQPCPEQQIHFCRSSDGVQIAYSLRWPAGHRWSRPATG